MSWNDDKDFVRSLCNKIEQSDTYKEYMASPQSDYEADREVWRKLYRQLIEDNADLDQLLEEKSLYWNDDKEVVDTFVLKTIKRFDPKERGNQELLPEYKDEDDREFARKLFRATILNANEYQRYMSEASRNWDFSRLHPRLRHDQRICGYGQALQHPAQWRLYQRYVGRYRSPSRRYGQAAQADAPAPGEKQLC